MATKSCKTIAWSKNGFIAYSSLDLSGNYNLSVTYMESIDGHSWRLANPRNFAVQTPLEDVTLNPAPEFDPSRHLTTNIGMNAGHFREHGNVSGIQSSQVKLLPITYIEWSSGGDYLSCSDAAGNMTIYASGISKDANDQYIYSSFNDFVMVYNDTVQDAPTDDMKTVTFKPASFPDINSTIVDQSACGDFPTKLIGLQWLNMDKMVYYMMPAVRVGTSSDALKTDLNNEDSGYVFSYSFHPQRPIGALHPFPAKQACIGVRKNGEVCLWYQSSHKLNFLRVTEPLDKNNYPNNYAHTLISYASFGFHKNGTIYLLAYCSFTRLLKVYNITINWGTLAQEAEYLKKNSSPMPQKDPIIPPSLIINRITQQYICPLSINGLPQEVSHIKLVSAGYSSESETSAIVVLQETLKNGIHTSTVVRYQLASMSSNLNSIFTKLKKSDNNNNSSDGDSSDASKLLSNTELDLVTREILRCGSSVACLNTVSHNAFLYIIFEDGNVEIRHTNNLKKKCGIPRSKNGNQELHKINVDVEKLTTNSSISDSAESEIPTMIMSIYDAGFKIQKFKEPPSFAIISPNMSAAVYLPNAKNKSQRDRLINKTSNSNEILLAVAENTAKSSHSELNPLDRLTISAAFARTHSSSCFRSVCTDDLIAVMQLEIEKYRQNDPQLAQKLITGIIQESYSALKFSLLYSNEQLDKLLGNPPLQRLISLQMALGTSANWQRSKSGKIAWAVLNLRLCAFGIMITLKGWYKDIQRISQLKSKQPQKLLPREALRLVNTEWRAEILAESLGVAKWVVNFVAFIAQELLSITILSAGPPQKFQEAFANSLAMPLILAKVPRVLLINSIKGLRQLNTFATKFVDEYGVGEESAVFHAAQHLKATINGSLVNIESFEKFLNTADFSVKTSINNYNSKKNNNTSNDSSATNAKHTQLSLLIIEQRLICQGVIPEELLDASKTTIKMFNETIRKETNCSQLYYYDLSWLGLYDSKGWISNVSSSKSFRKEEPKLPKASVATVVVQDTERHLVTPSYSYNRGERLDYLRRKLIPEKPTDHYNYFNVFGGPIPSNIYTSQKAKEYNAADKKHGNSSTRKGNASVNRPEDAQKVEAKTVKPAHRIKRCVRCGLISSIDDLSVILKSGGGQNRVKNTTNNWDMAFQRYCFCGACFVNIS